MSDNVLLEVYAGTLRAVSRAEAVLAGARLDRVKVWPTGAEEDVYVMPEPTARKGRRDHSENRGLGGGKVVLTAKEKRSLELTIGEPVSDAQDARRKMKAKGLRFLERGEAASDVFDKQVEYAESGGEARGVPPPVRNFTWDELQGREARKPFDWRERLAQNAARYRSEHPEES